MELLPPFSGDKAPLPPLSGLLKKSLRVGPNHSPLEGESVKPSGLCEG